jgi:hypothetical protein
MCQKKNRRGSTPRRFIRTLPHGRVSAYSFEVELVLFYFAFRNLNRLFLSFRLTFSNSP